ncbi:MAG: hypothetical protein JJ863_20550 [Deltaproteobacteria bacterium]|nr:hypothetical protein [Deltaproteobacteria bacterium]
MPNLPSSFSEIRAMLDDPASARGGSMSLREGSPEMDYMVARSTLTMPETGLHELKHGFQHLVELLALEPDDEEMLSLLDRYASLAGNLDALLPPPTGERYYAIEAIRARQLVAAGQLGQGVDLLGQVNGAKPGLRYLDAWALDWLEPSGRIESLPVSVVLPALATAMQSLAEAKRMTPKRIRHAERWARLAERVLAVHGQAGDPQLAANLDMLVLGLFRRAGLYEEGLRLAHEADRQRPTWNTIMAIGLIERARERFVEAEEAFAQGHQRDPSDIATFLETGDMWILGEQWTRARGYYEQVLARQPGHPWAEPSQLWCQWRERSSSRFPDDAMPPRFMELLRAGNGRANGLADSFRAFRGYVPEPSDATANTLRQVFEKLPPGDEGGSLQLTLSDVEGPSNQTCLALARPNVKLDVTYQNIARPDPREPIAPITHRLWSREGEHLVSAVAPPGEETHGAIARLAWRRFDQQETWAAASQLAESMTRSIGKEAAAAQLLATIPHPPALPEGVDVFQWVPHCQLAATFTLAQLDGHEGDWESSTSRAALFSLLHGPVDWSREYAVVALDSLVRDRPIIALDLHRAFTVVDEGRPNSGACPWEHTLLTTWAQLPFLYDEERDALWKRVDALD